MRVNDAWDTQAFAGTKQERQMCRNVRDRAAMDAFPRSGWVPN